MRAPRPLFLFVIALLFVLMRAAAPTPARAAGVWYVAPGGNDDTAVFPLLGEETAELPQTSQLEKPAGASIMAIKPLIPEKCGSKGELVNRPQDTADAWLFDPEQISDRGERVSHLGKDNVFYAHLSIYDFAKPFCKDAIVLDAGSGSGYGAAFLAEAGAGRVCGIDASAKAIAFSQYHFRRDNLEFRVMDLGQPLEFPSQTFDLIFTSNCLEHVPDTAGFLREAWRLLKPTGALLVAVPPITDKRLEYLNVINPYHVNIWTPRQWLYALKQFFGEITPYLHGVRKIGADFLPEDGEALSTITEKSFVFEEGTCEDMYRTFTLTSVFVARKPLAAEQVRASATLKYVDESYTRPAGYIDPKVKRRLREYFEPSPPTWRLLLRRARKILQGEGVLALAKRSAAFVNRRFLRAH